MFCEQVNLNSCQTGIFFNCMRFHCTVTGSLQRTLMPPLIPVMFILVTILKWVSIVVCYFLQNSHQALLNLLILADIVLTRIKQSYSDKLLMEMMSENHSGLSETTTVECFFRLLHGHFTLLAQNIQIHHLV